MPKLESFAKPILCRIQRIVNGMLAIKSICLVNGACFLFVRVKIDKYEYK